MDRIERAGTKLNLRIRFSSEDMCRLSQLCLVRLRLKNNLFMIDKKIDLLLKITIRSSSVLGMI